MKRETLITRFRGGVSYADNAVLAQADFPLLNKRRKASYIEDDVGLTVIDVQVAVTYWVFFRKLL